MKNDNTGQSQKTDPIKNKEEVRNNPDEKIDQDYAGYPASPAGDKIINPATREDRVNANLVKKEDKPYKEISVQGKGSQQMNTDAAAGNNENEAYTSLGSANAFEETEGPDIEEDRKPEKKNPPY